MTYSDDSLTSAKTTAAPMDALLLPYLQSADEAESENLAAHLISSHAKPIIANVLRRKLQFYLDKGLTNPNYYDAEDICGEVVLEVLARLRELKFNPRSKPISNFHGLVAYIADHACSEYLRKKKPRRSSLKNQIYYILTHREEFALWLGDNQEALCGLKIWKGQTQLCSPAKLQVVRTAQRPFWNSSSLNARIGTPALADLLMTVFGLLDEPVRLGDLTDFIADLCCITDQFAEADNRSENNLDINELADQSPVDVIVELEQRLYLERVWAEILLLSQRQRRALLLSLRDRMGRGVIALLPAIGITSFGEIAEALGMSENELSLLWNDLPMDDATISAHLGVTRQQVINLRKAARERLARRMKLFG